MMMGLGGIVGLLAASSVIWLGPETFESKAVLQVRPAVRVELPADEEEASQAVPRVIVEAEEVIVQSTENLRHVAEELGLEERWSKELPQVLARLRGMIEVEGIHGSDLIVIRVRARDPNESREIGRSISKRYRIRRAELANQRANEARQSLRDEVILLEDLVEEKRQELTNLIRAERIEYQPGSERGKRRQLAEKKRDDLAKRILEMEDEAMHLQAIFETLQRYDGDRLKAFAVGADFDGNPLAKPHFDYLEAERQLAALVDQGLEETDSRMVEVRETMRALEAKIEEELLRLPEVVKAQIEMVKEMLERLRSERLTLDASEETASTSRMSFEAARSEFETAQKLLEQAKIKEIQEQMQEVISKDSVIVHEDPVEGMTVYPGMVRRLVLGGGIGMAVGALLGPLLVPVLKSRDRGKGDLAD